MLSPTCSVSSLHLCHCKQTVLNFWTTRQPRLSKSKFVLYLCPTSCLEISLYLLKGCNCCLSSYFLLCTMGTSFSLALYSWGENKQTNKTKRTWGQRSF
jgi:hypothetical protein